MEFSWPCKEIWKGKDVFILGGGPSLKTFPISFLKTQKCIGCNHAYLFGPEVVDLLIFCDQCFYNSHKDRPAFINFPNPKISNSETIQDPRDVIIVPRAQTGWKKDALGFNANTGSAAINLALILGAARVFLVGFDMQLGSDLRQNWHKEVIRRANRFHYERYLSLMRSSVSDIAENWPEAQVINLNPDSKLDIFPKGRFEEYFKVPNYGLDNRSFSTVDHKN